MWGVEGQRRGPLTGSTVAPMPLDSDPTAVPPRKPLDPLCLGLLISGSVLHEEHKKCLLTMSF